MLDIVLWLGVAAACVVSVVLAGPYHQRIIDGRPKKVADDKIHDHR